MEPILFEPLPMVRVWGGRRLESLFSKSLPPGEPFGEIWEVVDRPEAQSAVAGGEYAGSTLHDLWSAKRAEIFGADYAPHPAERFPILIKWLDARERLSVQVHPPAHVAPSLGGEPKTEVWYFANCLPEARIYAGVKGGTTRESFEKALANGQVEAVLHEIRVKTGDSIFIPSGRIHAIGEGCVIAEIQQNSDTTYRVFDWNRTGLDGKPRELHIPESLACSDFSDIEPPVDHIPEGVFAECPHFKVERLASEVGGNLEFAKDGRFAIGCVLGGKLRSGSAVLHPGTFFLAPAGSPPARADESASALRITLPLG